MMSQRKNKKSVSGFTLMEMMLTIIIFSAVTLGISYTFSEIYAYYLQQTYYEDVANYGNTWADEIVDYIRAAEKITLTSRDGYRVIEIKYYKKDPDTGEINLEKKTFSASAADGILEDDHVLPRRRFKTFTSDIADYKLEQFWCDPIAGDLGNFSQGLNRVRKAIYEITIEIRLKTLRKGMTTAKTFQFKRRVFASNVYL